MRRTLLALFFLQLLTNSSAFSVFSANHRIITGSRTNKLVKLHRQLNDRHSLMGRKISASLDLDSILPQNVALAAFFASNILYVGQLLVQQRRKSDGDPYQLLQGVTLFSVPEGKEVRATDYWRKDQRSVVVFLRHQLNILAIRPKFANRDFGRDLQIFRLIFLPRGCLPIAAADAHL